MSLLYCSQYILSFIIKLFLIDNHAVNCYTTKMEMVVMKNEFEVIKYNEIKNLKVFIVNLAYRTLHVHKDFELLYVPEGNVEIRTIKGSLSLQKNEALLINSGLAHELQADDNVLILAMQISPGFCSDYFPQLHDMEFDFCILTSLLSEKFQQKIFLILLDLAHCYFKQEKGFAFKCMSLLNMLLFHITNTIPFRILSEEELNKAYTKTKRMRSILSYVESHYNEKLLLSDIALHEHLSVSYLSHFFTENFGLSFQEYLANLRCEHARQMLLLTTHTLLTISGECGFSDLRYLNQAFIKNYGCTPKQYRQNFERASLPGQQKSMLSTQSFLSRQTCLILLDKYFDFTE